MQAFLPVDVELPRRLQGPGPSPRTRGSERNSVIYFVVFENHILIFSDKDCRFNDAVDLNLAWSRWFKKNGAKNPLKQVWGAERWIRRFPKCLFLDRQCSIPFPINLPDPTKAIFHRIVVGARRIPAPVEKSLAAAEALCWTAV